MKKLISCEYNFDNCCVELKFNDGSMIEVQTHNTDLKKRLIVFAKEYPQCCRQIDDDEQGGMTFEIEKGRLSFRLTAPYSEERKQAASEWAKKNSIGTL